MARTPQEVFAHHVEALGGGDLDGIVADYAEDAVVISPAGVLRGPGRGPDRVHPAARGRPGRRLDPEDADLRG